MRVIPLLEAIELCIYIDFYLRFIIVVLYIWMCSHVYMSISHECSMPVQARKRYQTSGIEDIVVSYNVNARK